MLLTTTFKTTAAVLSCLAITSMPRPSANWWNSSESIAMRDTVLLVRQASPVKCLGDFRWYAGWGNTGWWICRALRSRRHLSSEAASWRAADERSSPIPVNIDVWNLTRYTIQMKSYQISISSKLSNWLSYPQTLTCISRVRCLLFKFLQPGTTTWSACNTSTS